MGIRTIKRLVRGKQLSEAKDWKTAETKLTDALTALKKVKSETKGKAAEAQMWIRQVLTIADAVTTRVGDVVGELVDDRGYSGIHPQVTAVEKLSDKCMDIEMYAQDAILYLETITGKVPAEKTGKASGSSRADLERYVQDAKNTAKKARGICKEAFKALEKADNAAQAALDGLPDDNEDRFTRNEDRFEKARADGSSDYISIDEWLDALNNADVALEYVA